MRFLAVAEAAVQFRIPVEELRSMCECGKIAGAVRFGRVWTLPETVSPNELQTVHAQGRHLAC